MTQPVIRAVVVDDEAPARAELTYLLSRQPDVQVVGTAASGSEAWALVTVKQPHIVFLDIRLPGPDGLRLAEEFLSLDVPPLVVFATAHDEYALKAFDLEAVDYLLKPFSEQRVAQCLSKVRTMLELRVGQEALTRVEALLDQLAQEQTPQKIAVEHNGRLSLIAPQDIAVAACDSGQVRLYTTMGEFTVNCTMQELADKLPRQRFFRTHRAYIVNIQKIREVIPWFNGTYNLVMEGINGLEVPVSRQQAPKLRHMLFR